MPKQFDIKKSKLFISLKRRFSSFFITALLKSPTLIDVIKQLEKKKIKIRCQSGACIGAYDSDKKTIIIGTSCPDDFKLLTLAHEYIHAMYGPLPNPLRLKMGKQEYIKACISEEVEAALFELKLMKELEKKANIKFSDNLISWKKFKTKAAMAKKLRKTENSISNQPYFDYYSEAYDDAVPEKYRKP